MNAGKTFAAVPALLGLAVIAALLSIQPLWGHRSDSGEIFGAYSTRYALVLAAHVGLSAGWVGLLLARKRTASLLTALARPLRCGGVALALLLGGAVWFITFHPQVKQYAAVSLLLVIPLVTARGPALYGARLLR